MGNSANHVTRRRRIDGAKLLCLLVKIEQLTADCPEYRHIPGLPQYADVPGVAQDSGVPAPDLDAATLGLESGTKTYPGCHLCLNPLFVRNVAERSLIAAPDSVE